VSSLIFLGIALGLSMAGFLVLWMRNRPPRSVDAHIRAFARELEALAPTDAPPSSPPPPRPVTRPVTPWTAPPRRGRRPG
jgi:hypothetical protein